MNERLGGSKSERTPDEVQNILGRLNQHKPGLSQRLDQAMNREGIRHSLREILDPRTNFFNGLEQSHLAEIKKKTRDLLNTGPGGEDVAIKELLKAMRVQ